MINQDGTKGKSFVSKNGVPCLVYWDLDNDGWRMATGKLGCEHEFARLVSWSGVPYKSDNGPCARQRF